MCMSGSPPTGRTRIRSPAMSVTPGATTTCTSSFSSSQTILRIWPAEPSAPPAMKMTSTPVALTTEAASSALPSTGMPDLVSSLRSYAGVSAPTTV